MGHEMGATAHQKDQNEVEVTPQGFRPPLKPTLLVTVLASASFFVTIVLLLSIGKAIVFVNVLGFVFPASATVHDMVCPTDTTSTSSSGTKTKTKTTERRGRGGDADLSSAYAGYWVLFGMFSAFDSILPGLTPFYFGVKACVLAWGASSARPYGGRRFLRRLFLAIEGDDDANKNTICVKTTMEIQVLVERTCRLTGLPPKASRLAWTTAAFAAGTVTLGACSWSVSIAEVWFSKLSRWVQDGVCVLAGASWPLWATSIALGRADAARLEKGSGGGESGNHQRQGPAVIQWLSYWLMFGFLEVFVDPVAGGLPHYYSIKLFVIATLALPQTRGAYLIASHVLGDRDKNFDDPVIATK
ncbi:unnamed protein product [Ascophyllum nodosum]